MTDTPTTIKSPVCLVAVSEYGELHSLLPLARDIETRFGLHPLFVFSPGYGKILEHGQLVELQGHSWVQLGGVLRSYMTPDDVTSEGGYVQVLPDGARNASAASPAQQQTGTELPLTSKIWVELDHLKNRVRRKFLGETVEGSAESDLRRQLRFAEEIFKRLDVRLIVSGQDYALSVTSILAQAGARRGVKLAIVPYSMPPTTREIVESFARLKINRIRKDRETFFKRYFPNWLMSYRGVTYSRLGARDMMLADRFGLTPPLPWTPNSGLGRLLLPSGQALDYYRRSGVAADQLVVTGAPWNDDLIALEGSRMDRKQQLFKRIRSELKASGRQGDIDTDKLVIVSWPPNQWPRAAMGCDTYNDLCRQFIMSLAAIQIAELAYVGVSLHPTVSDPAIINGLRRAGIVVLKDSLINLVDCADIFSATVSSTAFWAIQCGIPTINFDGYLYGYREFDDAGAITVRTPGQMRSVMDRLLSDEAAYAKAREDIVANRDYWTMRSGGSQERIMAELETMMLREPASAG
ncbi:hypothetical protein [Hoeflea sp.]|uniref:hypothetical protein n=1 Tax=Hoeflea sp. TaxID=1940281 RepID=UPI003BB20830